MSFREMDGDLFCLDFPAIGHGANCRGLMGAGIASQFRLRYREMYDKYAKLCQDGAFTLGGMMEWPTGEWSPEMVYNLATQDLPGPCADLNAIAFSIRLALADCDFRGIAALGVPRIGCGIGGLDWEDVRPVLKDAAAQYQAVDLIVVTLPAPGLYVN